MRMHWFVQSWLLQKLQLGQFAMSLPYYHHQNRPRLSFHCMKKHLLWIGQKKLLINPVRCEIMPIIHAAFPHCLYLLLLASTEQRLSLVLGVINPLNKLTELDVKMLLIQAVFPLLSLTLCSCCSVQLLPWTYPHTMVHFISYENVCTLFQLV